MAEQDDPTEPLTTDPEEAGGTEPAPVEEESIPKPTVVSTIRREPAPSERLKSIVESLLFVSDRPVTAKELGRALRTEEKKVRAVLEVLAGEWEGRGVVLAEVAGGFQLRSSPDNAQWVQQYLQVRPVRLSRAALETLAIIAYRQPLTRPEVDDLRGVDCGGVLKLLLDRGLIKIIGKKDEPGRPLLYGTTAAFLELFGLKSLRDLPTLRQFTELTEESQALVDRFDEDRDENEPARRDAAPALEVVRPVEPGAAVEPEAGGEDASPGEPGEGDGEADGAEDELDDDDDDDDEDDDDDDDDDDEDGDDDDDEDDDE